MAEIIEMPKLSDTMTTGTLIKWLKKEGDTVDAGDMIAEVETDKATMEVENFEDGVILKLYAKEGDSVAIGSPICAVGEKGEEAPKVEPNNSSSSEDSKDEDEGEDEDGGEDEDKPEKEESPSEESVSEAKSDPKSNHNESKNEKDSKAEKPPEKTETTDGSRIKASPLARKIAVEKGVDLSTVSGTGPAGRIVRDDVLEAAKNPPKKPATAAPSTATSGAPIAETTETKVSNMRASIARALVKSKQDAPHFYLQIEMDSKPLSDMRKSLNDKLASLPVEQGGIKFSVNDLILKASAEAARRVPAINKSWHGDKIIQHGSVQLAFGVAIDDGLLTPVIRDAHAKTLRQFATEAKELIGKARDKKLKPDEMSGSTLTVTNLGMYGISDFYGIINPPNAAILSVGATTKQVVVDENNEFKVGYRMKVGLSGDHRVIDGAVGAQYLAALKEIIETPSLMLV